VKDMTTLQVGVRFLSHQGGPCGLQKGYRTFPRPCLGCFHLAPCTRSTDANLAFLEVDVFPLQFDQFFDSHPRPNGDDDIVLCLWVKVREDSLNLVIIERIDLV